MHGSDFDSVHSVVVNPLSDGFFRQHRSNSWSDSLDDMKAVCALQENSFEPEVMSNSACASLQSGRPQLRGVILDPATNSKSNSLKTLFCLAFFISLSALYQFRCLRFVQEVVRRNFVPLGASSTARRGSEVPLRKG